MKIKDVRILPPIAIGRLGSSPNPLAAFELEPPLCDHPVGYRRIVPKLTFEVNDRGEVTELSPTPTEIIFKEADNKVRPVAPFLEVFAITDKDELVPLTLDLLKKANLKPKNISWSVSVGNHKIFRRTGDKNDKIDAHIPGFHTHDIKELCGTCPNFRDGKTLPLGWVRFIRPSDDFPQIRLRFTPAEGKVYGSSTTRFPSRINPTAEEPDPVITDDSLVLYDTVKAKHNAKEKAKANKGKDDSNKNEKVQCWHGFVEENTPTRTSPDRIFAGARDKDGNHTSWGYLDDECDGIVMFSLTLNDGTTLTARAVIVAGPPAYAPDSLPVRVVSDELEQILLGPEVGKLDVAEAMAQTQQIVRRSLDTVRLMNTAIANSGRNSLANQGDRGGQIMAPALVDNRAVVALHEQILASLASGTPPWFSEALRRPEEVGDLTDPGRRKMPALMRNADGNHLALTMRVINTVVLAEMQGEFQTPGTSPPAELPLTPGNLTAQLHHRAKGNPVSVLPSTAISNCYPGLEFDFRNFWRHAFEGIESLENSNLVIDAEQSDLIGCRLLRVDDWNVTVETQRPGGNGKMIYDVTFMEWSNSLARVLANKAGKTATCLFTKEKHEAAQVEFKPFEERKEPRKRFDDPSVSAEYKVETREVELKVRQFFEPNSATVAEKVFSPGELTQGLCAPWQNDYRECACFYWAASRPDYVNVEVWPDGLSRGDNWLAKERTGSYISDDRSDSRLVSYDDLFQHWEQSLRFIIGGRDADVVP